MNNHTTMSCLLCGTTVENLGVGNHMKSEHGVVENLDYIMSCAVMTQGQRDVVGKIAGEIENEEDGPETLITSQIDQDACDGKIEDDDEIIDSIEIEYLETKECEIIDKIEIKTEGEHKSQIKQMEEKALEHGLKFEFKFVNPPGYHFKRKFKVHLFLTGGQKNEKFVGQGILLSEARNEAARRANDFMEKTNVSEEKQNNDIDDEQDIIDPVEKDSSENLEDCTLNNEDRNESETMTETALDTEVQVNNIVTEEEEKDFKLYNEPTGKEADVKAKTDVTSLPPHTTPLSISTTSLTRDQFVKLVADMDFHQLKEQVRLMGIGPGQAPTKAKLRKKVLSHSLLFQRSRLKVLHSGFLTG